MNASRCARALGVLLVAAGLCSAQETARVSVDSSGSPGDDSSNWPSVCASGQFAAFSSFADNFASGDANKTQDTRST